MLQHRLGNGLGQDRNACFLQPGSLLVIKLRAHEQKKPRRAALCDFLRESQRLTRVALRFYGTKALWPYIVKYNPDIIKNPNHVPYGTTIKIPELVKK